MCCGSSGVTVWKEHMEEELNLVDKIHHEMQGNAQRDSVAAQSAELEIVSTGAEGVYTGDILLQPGQIGREKLAQTAADYHVTVQCHANGEMPQHVFPQSGIFLITGAVPFNR